MGNAVTSGVWTKVHAALPDLKGLNTENVRWGRPAQAQGGQSGYHFEGGTVPVLLDGSEFTLGTFTHQNFVIYSGSHPNQFEVDLVVSVTFDEGDLKREFSFQFHHNETPNKGGPIPDEVDLPTLQSPETVIIDCCEYAVLISGFKQDGNIVTKFISEENGANSADIVAKLVLAGKPEVVITDVRFKGEVKRTQADEYVEIVNRGTAPIDISGWVLGADDPGQDFSFPAGTTLGCGQKIRVYTDQVHAETGGFSYGIKRPIWNDKGDLAQLRDANGDVVSRYGYGDKALP